MKKNYIQPATEIVMVGAKTLMMLSLSNSSADSNTSVLSKERIVDFSESYQVEE